MSTTINGIVIQDQADSTLAGSATTPTATSALTITRESSYDTGSAVDSAEVVTYDKATHRVFVINRGADDDGVVDGTGGHGPDDGIDVLQLESDGDMTFLANINVGGAVTNFGGINSIAVQNGILAVAVQSSVGAGNGYVLLFDAATGQLQNTVDVGVLPDMLTFTPDGSKIIVANEGERSGSDDPAGSISIVDLSGGAATATAQTIGFSVLDGQEDALRALGVRITPGKSASVDLEPEYISLSADGKTAYVTLQEANSVAVFDVSGATPVFKSVLPLGYVDHSLVGNEGDYSDRDDPNNSTGEINLHTAPIKGMLMPDAIATWTFDGVTYFATANEGDARSDDSDVARLSSLDLNPTAFPDAATLQGEDDAGRLNVSTIDGDTDGNAANGIEEIYTFGGRGISVFRVGADGTIQKVDETGGEFEKIIAAIDGGSETIFNGQNGAGFDTRSDDKSTEPEGITVANVGGRIYAFTALEREGGIMAYDVTDPNNITYSQYVAPTNEDFGPEVIKYIDAVDSPTGKGMLLTANEISGTVTAYSVDPEVFTLQLLHLSDAEAGLLASDTAPNLAALIDAFDGDYANTLIMSGGDNFIPGPFLAAGTDLSVIPTLNAVTGSTIGLTSNVPIGAVDIAILNSLGVEVSTIGNHEFDLGSRVLRDAFSPNLGAAGWVGAQFAYLSSNLDFSGDADLNPRFTNTLDGGTGTLIADASTLKGRIAPATVVEKGGEKIGIIGATTQLLEIISSPTGTEVKGFPTGPGGNGEVDDMDLLAAQLQPIIDEMIAEGINKIIVQSHLQQIENEQLLATKLHGVDIILSAGSHSRLADADDELVAFPGHDPNAVDTYPIVTQGTDGKTTLIVNTDSEYTYLGRLVVDFDANGDIILDSVTDNQAINGAYASTEENVAEAWGTTVDNLDDTAFADGTKGDKVRDLTDAVQQVINVKDSNVYGFTNVYLEGDRSIIRNEETNLGDISADANSYVLRQALGTGAEGAFIVSLKNGGGIRAQIGTVSAPDPVTGEIDKLPPPANPDAGKPEGGVSQLDVENSLRFNNKLMVFDTTPQGLLNILNWGAGLSANNGGFPQIGGVKFSYDPDLPGNSGTTPGSRIRDVALIDDDGNVVALLVDDGVVLPDAPETISVVTLNFTANGGDGYPVKANADNFRYLLNDGGTLSLSAPVDEALDFTATANVPANALGEQDAFGDYMQAFHGTQETAYDQADTPASEDIRIQNLNVRSDTVFDSAPLFGDETDDILTLTVGNDRAIGSIGIDTGVFASNLSDYTVTRTGVLTTVHGADGVDFLSSVEKLQFADGTLNNISFTGDFNGDGTTDIALQNGSLPAVWLLDEQGIAVGSGNIAPLNSGWYALAAGDFNGDTRDDLLLQNGQQLAVWQMNGTQIEVGSGNIGTLLPGWVAADTGDFDGDGSDDILLQNGQQLALWQMNGTQIEGGGNINTLLPGWAVAGSGDFNGDNHDDILLQNGQQLAVWQMNGTQIQAGGPTFAPLLAGWSVAGVADFTNDGQDDVLLQNGQDLAVWITDDTGGQSGNIGTLLSGWSLAGVGDFDGDGSADLLLQNGQQLAEWLLDGKNLQAGSGNLAALGQDWALL